MIVIIFVRRVATRKHSPYFGNDLTEARNADTYTHATVRDARIALSLLFVLSWLWRAPT